MAHKKAGGSTKNGRDSHSKRLGVKRFGGEQVLAGTRYMRGIFERFVRGLVVPAEMFDQIRKPNDRVERRPEFVAHVREKFGLGAVGHLGFECRRTQSVFAVPSGNQISEVCRVIRQK